MLIKIRQKNAHPWWRRCLNWLRLRFGGAIAKSHRVYFVRVGKARYKRVVFGHAAEARMVAEGLERLSALKILPPLVHRHEDEIWVQFMRGKRPQTGDAQDMAALKQFFVTLYSQSGDPVNSARTPFRQALRTDLDFLTDTGVLAEGQGAQLLGFAEVAEPAELLIGFDYIDPVLKNFIIQDGRAFGIDVDSLHASQLLGAGLAKARLRWLGEEYAEVLADLDEVGVGHLRAQFDFAELCFLAAYTKQKVLQGKRSYVQPDLFRRFLTRALADR